MHKIGKFATALLVGLMAGPMLINEPASAFSPHPEARVYNEKADAKADLLYALDRAKGRDLKVLAVLGANWCHDSRAMAGWLETDRFRDLADRHFIVVYIDIGKPQDDEGRNLDLAAEYGLVGITNTPVVAMLTADGSLINSLEDAKSWRNAASRSEDEIYNQLAAFAASEG